MDLKTVLLFSSLYTACLCLSPQVLVLCIIQLERVRGCRSSVFLFLFWVMAVVCSLVPLRAKIQLAMDEVCQVKQDIAEHRPTTVVYTLYKRVT